MKKPFEPSYVGWWIWYRTFHRLTSEVGRRWGFTSPIGLFFGRIETFAARCMGVIPWRR